MARIRLPHNFTPRSYQLPVLKALDRGAKRCVAVWHRRAGKEKTFINHTARACFERVGTYFYLFPTYTQAKRAIWDGRDRDGFPFLAHFPAELVKARNEQELKVTFTNGSIFQLVGADSYDSLMSTNPLGCVFAEYALQDPRAWDYFRPILRENGGWAVFDYTPRGKNHGYTMYETARQLVELGDVDWFCERLTIDDTGVMSAADIDAERRAGMDEDLIRQEFYCSFEGAQQGSYFGAQLHEAENQGRICQLPIMPTARVHTWWDLGMRDAMAIWFTQDVGPWVHVLDYYEDSGGGIPAAARALESKGYLYGGHHAPHDARVREMGSGKSRIEMAAELGIKFDVVPNLGVQDGIDAARAFFSRCRFDREKTERGRLALISYHKVWDDKRRCFSDHPYHDWSSNGADAFRYLAVGHKATKPEMFQRKEPDFRPRMESGNDRGWLAA